MTFIDKIRNLFRTRAAAIAAERAATDRRLRDEAKRIAAQKQALQREIDAIDDTRRRSYYAASDFARYQAALQERQRDANGVLGYVDFNDFVTAPPTREQWAEMAQRLQGNAPGL